VHTKKERKASEEDKSDRQKEFSAQTHQMFEPDVAEPARKGARKIR
jgi:hypothetical protein